MPTPKKPRRPKVKRGRPPKQGGADERTTVHLSPEKMDVLRRLAHAQGLPPGALARRLLEPLLIEDPA